MSDNAAWLEAASELFDGAVEEGNYSLCKDIIADMLDVDPTAGRALALKLREVPVAKFAVKSPYQDKEI